MRSTSATFKQIMQSGTARKYLVKIYITFADGTTLPNNDPLTEDDIWMDSFQISTASSGQSSFDIGTAVIGECKFQINNVNGAFDSYDFFNAQAVVWIGLDGDKTNDVQNYYRMGFYTVDEPTYEDNLVSLTLLDNMWKFDVPVSDANITIGSSTTARSIVQAICSYCNVTLATQSFNGYNFPITQAPDEIDSMNCRELLQYVAMIGCNFCVIDDQGNLNIKWYNTSATGTDVAQFPRNFSSVSGTDEITITGVKFTIDETDHRIGTTGYVLELTNPLVNANNVNAVLNSIWNVLSGFKLRTFQISTLTDLAVEVGDKCSYTDGKGSTFTSYVTNNTFGFSSHDIECNAITQSRSLTVRYSKEVQAIVEESKKQARKVVSDYDQAVQMMNNLAVNAMGGYQDYEDLSTGGRIYYLSNRPITKDAQTGQCSFQSGSTVFKISGDGFFVSVDGGTTWTNGYNAQTGNLVVNVLNAIGINAEWVKTGTLTVGGSHAGTTNPTISVVDYFDNEVCTINSRGIIMHQGYLMSPDYQYDSSTGEFSTSGMMINVNTKEIRSPHFAFDSGGAYIDGEVNADSGHIGAATITQDAIKVIGDVDLYSGSGTFTFRPTDYYFAYDFYLRLVTEGTCTVTIVRHENGIDYTDFVVEVTSDSGHFVGELDHTIGTDPDDYYQITISGSSCDVTVSNVILAYMGEEGFQGTLRGIFKGNMDGNGKFRGYLSSSEGILNGATYSNGSGSFVKDGQTFSFTDGFIRSNGTRIGAYDTELAVTGATNTPLKVKVSNEGNESTIEMSAPHTGNANVTRMIPLAADPTLYVSDNPVWHGEITIDSSPPASGTTLPNGSFWLVVEPVT